MDKKQENLIGLIQTLICFPESWRDYKIWFKDKLGSIYPISSIGMTAYAGCESDKDGESEIPIGFTLQEATEVAN